MKDDLNLVAVLLFDLFELGIKLAARRALIIAVLFEDNFGIRSAARMRIVRPGGNCWCHSRIVWRGLCGAHGWRRLGEWLRRRLLGRAPEDCAACEGDDQNSGDDGKGKVAFHGQ